MSGCGLQDFAADRFATDERDVSKEWRKSRIVRQSEDETYLIYGDVVRASASEG